MIVAIDLGGVVTRYPREIRYLVESLLAGGSEVHFVSDCPLETMDRILIDACIATHERIFYHSVEWTGDESKSRVLKQIRADIFIDDHLGYILGADGACKIRLLVVPSPSEPYNCLEQFKDAPEDQKLMTCWWCCHGTRKVANLYCSEECQKYTELYDARKAR